MSLIHSSMVWTQLKFRKKLAWLGKVTMFWKIAGIPKLLWPPNSLESQDDYSNVGEPHL